MINQKTLMVLRSDMLASIFIKNKTEIEKYVKTKHWCFKSAILTTCS